MKKCYIFCILVNQLSKTSRRCLIVVTLLSVVPCTAATIVVILSLFLSAAIADFAPLVAINIPLTVPPPCLLKSSMSNIATVFLLLQKNFNPFFFKTVIYLTASSLLLTVSFTICFIKIIKRNYLHLVSSASFIPLEET